MPTPNQRRLLFGRPSIPYLLGPFRFGDNAASPLPSPYTEPGAAGSLTIVDTGSKISKAGGYLVIAGGTALGDPSASGAGLTRLAGRAVLGIVRAETLAAGHLGWSNALNGAVSYQAIMAHNDGNIYLLHSASQLQIIAASLNADYPMALVLRGVGGFWIATIGGLTKLLWVNNALNTTPLYPSMGPHAPTEGGRFDNFRVVDLRAPWDSDYGIATQRLAGALPGGTQYVHEANALIEFTATTLPSAAAMSVGFRKQDANNFWAVEIEPSGNVTLYEYVSGWTGRGSAAGVVSNGSRVVVIADGTTIKVLVSNIVRITYASATNFQAATAGEIRNLGTGGAISDLISWPRTLSGAALAELNRVSP